MIETLKNTALYKSLNLNKNMHHAYLFYSLDRELNNAVAMSFAKTLICKSGNSCNSCSACKQFDSNSHPDFFKLDQPKILVEDINNLIDKLNTKPISSTHKIFVVLNAENINEISQNKLLKSLEEPNKTSIFIFTTSKIDKILPTVLSRMSKVTIPKITANDLVIIKNELFNFGVRVENYIDSNFDLTEILNFETNENYKKTLKAIEFIFQNLNSSQDIPKVSSSITDYDKTLFLPILQKLFLSCINNQHLLDNSLVNLIKNNYPIQALINSLPLIENAYLKQTSNVNFGYIIDNLLFDILKEKFLCKQQN